jgi:hypothetical protein
MRLLPQLLSSLAQHHTFSLRHVQFLLWLQGGHDGASYSSSRSDVSDSEQLFSSSPMLVQPRPSLTSPPPGVPPLPLREHGLVAETPRGLRRPPTKAPEVATRAARPRPRHRPPPLRDGQLQAYSLQEQASYYNAEWRRGIERP